MLSWLKEIWVLKTLMVLDDMFRKVALLKICFDFSSEAATRGVL